MMNEVYLRRCLKVIPKDNEGIHDGELCTLAELATMQKNLESLGFALSQALVHALKGYSTTELTEFYKDLSKQLREFVGANRKLKPMYPGFPKQVMETAERVLAAIKSIRRTR